jgi:hypothetical protein
MAMPSVVKSLYDQYYKGDDQPTVDMNLKKLKDMHIMMDFQLLDGGLEWGLTFKGYHNIVVQTVVKNVYDALVEQCEKLVKVERELFGDDSRREVLNNIVYSASGGSYEDAMLRGPASVAVHCDIAFGHRTHTTIGSFMPCPKMPDCSVLPSDVLPRKVVEDIVRVFLPGASVFASVLVK